METKPPDPETTWVVDERRRIDWAATSCLVSCVSLILLCASVVFLPLAHILGVKLSSVGLIGCVLLLLAAVASGLVGLYMGIGALCRECGPKRFAIAGIVFSLPASLLLVYLVLQIVAQ